ncbi:MAG: hypothetical protein NVSMB1_21390 [Polyangiales bacterium]
MTPNTPRLPRLSSAIFALAVTTVVTLTGCNGQTFCDCLAPSQLVNVGKDGARRLVRAEATGSHCALRCFDADLRPAEEGRPKTCAKFMLEKSEPGTCLLSLTFDDGSTFSKAVKFVDRGTASCCAGIYPEVQIDITVPVPSNADAGVDGSTDGSAANDAATE